MSFDNPWILWFAPAYLLIELLLLLRIKKQQTPLPAAPWIKAPRTWRTTAVRFARFLPAFAFLLALIALAGPHRVETRKEILPSGIDILVALDVSGSMAAEDFLPHNRLGVAKEVLHDFIEGRPSDRIGLVLFAGRSVTRSPLTLQHDALQKTLAGVDMGTLPEGTAIGSAMMSGLNRLRKEGDRAGKGDRILLLITDGRNNAGEIHPADALPVAIQLHVKIYTIGVGGYGKVPFPVFAPNGKKSYRYEEADIDEPLLREMAEKTGGRYFRASDPKTLSGLFTQINTLEKSEPLSAEIRTVNGRQQLFLIPALLLGIFYALFTINIIRLP